MSFRLNLESLRQESNLGGPGACLLLLVVVVALGYRYRATKTSAPVPDVKSQSSEEREPGEWTPESFPYPAISPCAQALEDIQPIPYRPFRWGAYHVTMGIRNMKWDEWIELDKDYAAYHKIKAHRVRTRAQEVLRVLGDSTPDQDVFVRNGRHAAVELVHELAGYVSVRYPRTFRVTRDSEKGYITEIHVVAEAVDASYKLPLPVVTGQEEVGQEEAEWAMEVAGMLVEDDLAVMIEGSDGRYYFQAGSICLAGFWRLSDKIGLGLEKIHTNGKVPQYLEKLQPSLDRFFRRIPVRKPVIRNNYFFQVVQPSSSGRRQASTANADDVVDPEEIGWSYTTNGPEESFVQGHSHSESPAVVTAETLRFRTERQTLRRLGVSGAVVFTIRTYVVPVVEMVREKGTARRLASAVRSWKDAEGVERYKGLEMYGDVLLGYLDQVIEEEGEWNGEESNRNYPF